MKKILTAKPISRNKFTAVKTSKEANGYYALAEPKHNPKGGNPSHRHSAQTETFLSIGDKLGVRVNNEQFELVPGQSMKLPVNKNHQLFNRRDQKMTLHIKFEPGHDNFIKGLAAQKIIRKKGSPKSLTNLAIIFEPADTRSSGVLGTLFPVFRRLAFRAKKKGTEEKLPDRYYYE